MRELLKNLSSAKKEIGAISKDSRNPFFKSKYFDINQLLEHTEPILEKHGLIVLQPITRGFVSTIILDVKSGEEILSEIELPNIQDPQKLGSAITYYRRYTLASLLALQSTDDDANLASKPKTQSKKKVTDGELNGMMLEAGVEDLRNIIKTYDLTPKQKEVITKLGNKLKK